MMHSTPLHRAQPPTACTRPAAWSAKRACSCNAPASHALGVGADLKTARFCRFVHTVSTSFVQV